MSELSKLGSETVNLEELKKANVVQRSRRELESSSGAVDRSYIVECPAIKVTKGALKAIESAGGKVLDVAQAGSPQNGLQV